MKLTFTQMYVAVVVLLAGLACSPSGGNSGPDTITPEDTTADNRMELSEEIVSTDNEPPEFRDVRVELTGEYATLVDLNSGPSSPIIPIPVPALFTVFVKDDESVAENLTVTLMDPDSGLAIPDQDSTFKNGLWRIEITVSPGDSVVVQTADEAGNKLTWEHGLVIPSLNEAVLGKWTVKFFNDEQVYQYGWLSEWFENLTWEEERQDSDITLGGTYAIDGNLLTVTENWHSKGNDDDSTIEWQKECVFYVDDVYFHDCPFVRVGDGEDIVDIWERSFKEYELLNGDSLTLTREVTQTLTVESDSSWQIQELGTADTGTGLEPVDETMSGTYIVELNDNYIDDFGDFLHLTHTPPEGSQDEPEKSVHLFRIRMDRLLMDMKVRK